MSAGGAVVRVGNRAYLLSEGVGVARAEALAQEFEAQRRAALFVAVGDRVEGVLSLEDPLRPEARAASQGLLDLGVDVVLLSGASRGAVEAIGAALDVVDVRPEVPPSERAATVRALRELSEGVAVVGVPVRDGAVLGAGALAVALGAARGGPPPAAVLAVDELRALPRALSLARAAQRRAVSAAVVSYAGALGGALLAAVPGSSLWILAAATLGVAALAGYGAGAFDGATARRQRSGESET